MDCTKKEHEWMNESLCVYRNVYERSSSSENFREPSYELIVGANTDLLPHTEERITDADALPYAASASREAARKENSPQ